MQLWDFVSFWFMQLPALQEWFGLILVSLSLGNSKLAKHLVRPRLTCNVKTLQIISALRSVRTLR
jgi:hypothetical protein